MHKYDINNKVSEQELRNQNPAKGVNQELRKKWYQMMFNSISPQRLRCYRIPYLAKVMQQMDSHYGNLDGRTPIEKITGDTPAIYEYIGFGFYDWVVYKNKSGLGEVCLGRFLDVSHGVGSLM